MFSLFFQLLNDFFLVPLFIYHVSLTSLKSTQLNSEDEDCLAFIGVIGVPVMVNAIHLIFSLR